MQHSISLSAHPVTRAPESLPPLRSLWAALSCPRGYDIRPARTPKHHGLANSLVRRMYAWRGYRTELHRQSLEDPNHVTLAAWQYDEVVATLTLRRDDPATKERQELVFRLLHANRFLYQYQVRPENGLVRRVIRLAPNAATVAYENLMTGESVIRAVRPKASVELDGVKYDVGGLIGQPVQNYLDAAWVEQLKTALG